MSYELRVAPPEHLGWLGERLHCAFTSAARGIEALRSDGEIVAMVAFDDWLGNSAHMHFAFEEPHCARRLLPRAFSWVFSHKDVVVGWLPASRPDLLELGKRLGFTELCRVGDGFARGDDLVMLALRREDCRWLKE